MLVGLDGFFALFQSTLSMRRATQKEYFDRLGGIISIHALHEESDFHNPVIKPAQSIFQSTLSMRRATVRRSSTCPVQSDISIHALHEESD